MKSLKAFVLAALFFVPALVHAAVPLWGQCGGINHSGETTSTGSAVCARHNEWYSQCIPGSAPSSSSSESAPPSTTSSSQPAPTSTGFVKTDGAQFVLDGQKYTLVGSNSYWVGLSGLSATDMNQAFSDIAAGGQTTVRTWGFYETADLSNWMYYQSWSGSTPTVNFGANGLQNFDKVVAAAKANGIRLIVALTNNWSDYGGMDVYVKQILNSDNHDLFYTDARVKASPYQSFHSAFKSYIKTFIGRYVNEPTILGWELANEPRCRGTTGTTSGTCTTATITEWAKDISAYIKSIDANHLVALGDEGFYNVPGHPIYVYQGTEGIDFDVNLAISTIDFGTVHAYPEHWGQSGNETAFGNQWILDHVASGNKVNKPVILEEFGVTTNKPSVYAEWLKTIETSGMAGDLYWQAGSHLPGGDTHNDGYAIYPDSDVAPLLKSHAAKLKARST